MSALTESTTVDLLAADIREADGDHSLGAGALAEALTAKGWVRDPAGRAAKFDGIQDAVEEVHYRFSCYTETSDMVNRAHHLVELSNAVGDLASWHDSHSSDSHTLGWQREDESAA